MSSLIAQKEERKEDDGRMKKAMGLFALLIVCLSVAGFAYAHWSDKVTFEANVSMGSFTMGFTRIVSEWDIEDWVRYYNMCDDDPLTPIPPCKDIGTTFCWLEKPYTDVHSNKTIYKKLWCYLNNTYGGYWGINKFTIDNAGTIPANIWNVTILYDPEVLNVTEVIPNLMWEFKDITEEINATVFNVWLYKEPPDYGPGWEIDPPWRFPCPYPETLVGEQIDPCNELLAELCVHVKETAPECHTYYFGVDIDFVQWNWPEDP